MQITHAKLHHLTAPAPRQIKTSFGTMQNRHAIFLELTAETESGTHTGYGESWINFPTWAPEERKVAFHQAYIPYLLHKEINGVSDLIADMFETFGGPAVQADTVGATVASLCAVELALWDVEAKSKNLSLSRLWFSNPAQEIEVYASGINAPLPFEDIDQMLNLGVKLFKLKLGFGQDNDIANLAALQKHLNGRAQIAVDVNRGWTLQQAIDWLPRLKDHDIRWLEEPLRKRDEVHYHALCNQAPIPIAAGENEWNPSDLANLPVRFLQPDITKNSFPGITVSHVAEFSAKVIPHFLGSAIGQAASLHLAAGCQLALCEWDINPNPLRTDIFTEPFTIKDGKIKLPTTPGIGWTPKPFPP
jgi:L-alanine-DL-glutamate epimerase-like enolase superfamily enzyme